MLGLETFIPLVPATDSAAPVELATAVLTGALLPTAVPAAVESTAGVGAGFSQAASTAAMRRTDRDRVKNCGADFS